ncbi:sigma-70 family RNA polymerase sigma factor [Actinoplanes sp. ATCC 53533]|uniref:sigma-70 family RNA polymerase sigma factor n=1 Tax=Actinoplanes sp. ATCC 53533 TaxID=1288362 RepID=UPI000F79F62F|nr:sigma-70 family RNA polymerase sigma factor [Actinoplanes sp. ATCC 53533]
MQELEAVRAATDPLDRVRLATEALAGYQEAIADLGRIRRDAVDYLRSQGMTLSDIADQAGVSRARLSQLSTTKRTPERIIFSEGSTITIAVDTKQEESGRPVVHQEHTAAIEILTRTARKVGLEVNETEYIVSPGLIDLNREGLVVVCGPRRSPLIAQMLAADERYGFGKDDQGWYLMDKSSGEQYRSPEDSGKPGDYAYLGRLPRPDGRGFWLYMAGIHAPGGQGAAMFLEKELSDLYRDAKAGRWSCLVKCQWDSTTGQVQNAELLTPIHHVGRPGARSRRK